MMGISLYLWNFSQDYVSFDFQATVNTNTTISAAFFFVYYALLIIQLVLHLIYDLPPDNYKSTYTSTAIPSSEKTPLLNDNTCAVSNGGVEAGNSFSKAKANQESYMVRVYFHNEFKILCNTRFTIPNVMDVRYSITVRLLKIGDSVQIV